MKSKLKLNNFPLKDSESQIDTYFRTTKEKHLAKQLIVEIINSELESNLDICCQAFTNDLCKILDLLKGFPVSGFIKAEILHKLFNDGKEKHYIITINEID